jgi:hypothetical protein
MKYLTTGVAYRQFRDLPATLRQDEILRMGVRIYMESATFWIEDERNKRVNIANERLSKRAR